MGNKKDFSDILIDSFKKRKAGMQGEDMIEITFSEPRPMTDEEKKSFEARMGEAKESGEIDDIMIPKFFDDGRVEMVNYEDIKKEQDEKYKN